MLRPLLTVIFSAALISLMGQNSFHRVYTVDVGHHTKNQAAGQLADGNFISMDLLEDTLRDAANDLIITLFNKKGGISKLGELGERSFRVSTFKRDQYFLPQKTSVLRNGLNIYFTGLWQENDTIFKVFGSLHPQGQLSWFHRYRTAAKSPGINSPFLMDDLGMHIYLGTNQRLFNLPLVSLAKMNDAGIPEWSSIYHATKDTVGGPILNQTLTDLQITRDSTMLIAGMVRYQNTRVPFVMESDTLGTMIWSRMYFDTLSEYYISNTVETHKYQDSSFVFACGVDSTNLVNQPSGLIVRTDTLGEVVWARKLDFGVGSFTRLNNMTVGNDNQIVVSGLMRDSISGPDFHWMAKIMTDGRLDWVKKYPRLEIDGRIDGNLISAMDNGYAIFSTVDEGSNYLNFIKTDINGSSSCETEVDLDILSAVDLTSAPLIFTKFDTAVVEKAEAELDNYKLSPPVLVLNRDPVYCPNEEINHVFDATTNDAVYYKWSTGVEGDSASMITVHDIEMYDVMVTIDDGKECFTLCDTANLRRHTLPTGAISYSLGDFCTTGLVTLTINAAASAGVKSILWNTGGMTNMIQVGTAGIYSVTVTDNCDEVLVQTFDLMRMPEIVTSASIVEDFTSICINGQGVLQATHNSFGLPIEYKWSTNAQTQFIAINEGGEYCVTVTDFCGNSATHCITVDQAKFREVKIDDVIVDETNRCVNNTVSAEVFFTGDANIRWSTGETAKSIVINMGTFSSVIVTISDKVCPENIDTFKVNLPQIYFLDELEIDFDKPVECINDEVTLTVIYNENILKPADASILWSTGETTKSIKVTENGTYAVTVSDKNCAINRQGKVLNFVFPIPDVVLIPDSSALCTQNTILLSVFFNDDEAPIENPQYLWSNGSTSTSIIVADEGVYSVTVSDPQCALNSASASYEFVFPNANMRFAAAFFPSTRDTSTMELNATFGPYLRNSLCPESIQNYEFYVFNRWGQKVFESFDPDIEWNGTMRNEDASQNPTESYVWAVKYTLFGKEYTDRGDVLLIR